MLWGLLAILPALALFFWWAWRTRQALIAQFVQTRLLSNLTSGVSFTRQKIRIGLLLGAVCFLFLALARPQWGFSWEEAKQRGLDIIVAVDTSRSMLAQDITPDRLTRAKLAAFDLMHEAKTDRLGLIAFAGTAFLQCPLTLDEEAFRQSVNVLDTDIIPQGGTAIAQAIETSVEAFNHEEDNHKVLVLFTDGEDHEEGAMEAAKKAAAAGVRIFTIGVGTPKGEMLQAPGEDGKLAFIKDEQGNAIKSRLNEDLLREIATVANGFYLPLNGAKTANTLYEKGLAPLPKSEISSKFVKKYHERFQWPLDLAIVLLLIEMFLPERRRKETANTSALAVAPEQKPALIAALILLLPLGAQASPSSARRDYDSGKYQEAQEEYGRLLEKKPDDPRLKYNEGAAAFRAHEYEKAAKDFEAALISPDVNLQQSAYYNRGNSWFRLGEGSTEPDEKSSLWQKATEDYDRALKLTPQDQDAKHNLELVKKKLEELKKQQQQQKSQDSKDSQKNDQPDQKDNQNQQSSKGKSDSKDQKQQDSDQKNDQKQKQQANRPSEDKKKQDQQNQKAAKKEPPKDNPSEEKSDSASQSDGKKNGQNAKPTDENAATAGAQAQLGALTKEQAQQLLDSIRDTEKMLIFQPPPKPGSQKRSFKNW